MSIQLLSPNSRVHGRYQVVRMIGQGGMGAVYEALDLRLKIRVALKQTTENDPHYLAAFEREAQLLAGLQHSGIPHVSDYFTDGQGQFLVMQYIEGINLDDLYKRERGSLPVMQVLGWADELLDVLVYLHSRTPPIFHRDIKPSNIKRTPEGKLILLDFGLAKGTAAATSLQSKSARSVFGYTLDFAPLEQIQGQGTDARSDLYSLAATLYWLLSGKELQNALTRAGTMYQGQSDPLRPLHEVNPQVPRQVSDALMQALAIKRDDRPPDAPTLKGLLWSSAGVRTVTAPRPAPARPAPVPVAPTSTPPVPVAPVPVPAPNQSGTMRWPFIGGGILLAVIALLMLFFNAQAQQAAEQAATATAQAEQAATATAQARPAAAVTTEAQFASTQVLAVEIAPGTTMELVKVPAGMFLMGSPNDEKLYLDTFAIGKTEVTNAQFRPFVQGDGYTNSAYWTEDGWAWRERANRIAPYYWNDATWNGDTQPVNGVTWYEAMAYAAWLSAQTGGDYRLPSEAEWEKAACGTDTRRYPWGDEPPDGERANFDQQIGVTTPVGSFPAGASPYGALDMAGNVWEWTRSEYPDYRRNDFALRGGSWYNNSAYMQCSERDGYPPGNGGDSYGFRVVCAPCLR